MEWIISFGYIIQHSGLDKKVNKARSQKMDLVCQLIKISLSKIETMALQHSYKTRSHVCSRISRCQQRRGTMELEKNGSNKKNGWPNEE